MAAVLMDDQFVGYIILWEIVFICARGYVAWTWMRYRDQALINERARRRQMAMQFREPPRKPLALGGVVVTPKGFMVE